jgi:hypothetical protein
VAPRPHRAEVSDGSLRTTLTSKAHVCLDKAGGVWLSIAKTGTSPTRTDLPTSVSQQRGPNLAFEDPSVLLGPSQ